MFSVSDTLHCKAEIEDFSAKGVPVPIWKEQFALWVPDDCLDPPMRIANKPDAAGREMSVTRPFYKCTKLTLLVSANSVFQYAQQ